MILSNELPKPDGPGDAELGEQIATSETLAQKLASERKSDTRHVAPKRPRRGFYDLAPLPEVPPEQRLPMPKAMPAPARKLAEDIRAEARAAELAAEAVRERHMMEQMRKAAAAEERSSTSKKFCPRCANQPWRRAKEGVCLCGGHFEPEVVEIILERCSPIALCR